MAFWLNWYIASVRTYASFVLSPPALKQTSEIVTGNDLPIVTGNDSIWHGLQRINGNEDFHA